MTTIENSTVYFGKAKEVQTKFGPLINISFSREDLEGMIDNMNDKEWVNLTLQSLKNPSKYSSHSIKLDTFVPKSRK